MSLWKDANGGIHDDADGAALSLPIWPQGMVQITQAEADALLAPPPPTIAQIQAQLEAAVQTYLDSKAKSKGYDSANSCISYLNSTNAIWKADATAMNAWRDAVWSYCYTNASSATSSTTWAQLLPLLPVAPW